MFTVVRSAAAIAIALLVAMLLIFVSADADGVAAKFSLTVDALRQLNLFVNGQSGFAADVLEVFVQRLGVARGDAGGNFELPHKN